MEKNFDAWNQVKKRTDTEQPRLYTVREIWWCRIGINVGTEQNGSPDNFVRPALILRGLGPDACLVIPLTTSKRTHRYRISIGSVNGRDARANVSQLRIIDTRRLAEKIGFLDKENFLRVRKAAKDML